MKILWINEALMKKEEKQEKLAAVVPNTIIKELTQKDGSKTQNCRITKKCSANCAFPILLAATFFRHFSVLSVLSSLISLIRNIICLIK